MVKINFQNNITKANADTFNTMQDNIENGINDAIKGDLVVDSIKSKNLFGGFLSGAYNSSTGVFDTSTSGIATRKIDVISGDKYCLSGIQTGNTIRVLFWNDNIFVSSTTLTTQTENVITMLGNKFAFQTATTTPYTNIQLEKGESATTYKPYENLDGQEFYSGVETKIGTWINGKPLYRRVYESSTYSTQINLAISNIDKITNIVGLIKRSDYDIWQYLPSRLDNAGFSAQFGNLQYTSSNLAINLSLGTSWSSSFSRMIITLEYTKTTD